MRGKKWNENKYKRSKEGEKLEGTKEVRATEKAKEKSDLEKLQKYNLFLAGFNEKAQWDQWHLFDDFFFNGLSMHNWAPSKL